MKINPLTDSTRFGLIAPASAPADLDLIDKGVRYLEDKGYTVSRHTPEYSPTGYLAGSDDQRIEELNATLANPDVDVVVCARGGYGALRILDRVDYESAARYPKLLIGYSDITALQLALLSKSDCRSVSGPMVAIEWARDDYPVDNSIWNLLRGDCPSPLLGPDNEGLTAVQKGTADGMLVGGNLSVICKLIGSPYLPDLTGAILFIEEVSELPYQIDGMFAQLRLSGILGKLGGLIIGDFSPPEPMPDKPTFTYEEVIQDYAGDINGPVASDLVYGHIKRKVSVPIGVRARLLVDDEKAELHVLEPVVAEVRSET